MFVTLLHLITLAMLFIATMEKVIQVILWANDILASLERSTNSQQKSPRGII